MLQIQPNPGIFKINIRQCVCQNNDPNLLIMSQLSETLSLISALNSSECPRKIKNIISH